MRRLGRRLLREQQGASTVIVAICMTAVLIVLALVVDIGATAARKAQLQDAADAAALAIAQQCYESDATTTLNGCDPAVRSTAGATATDIARATVNDGVADLSAAPDFTVTSESVTVSLSSAQAALFSWAAGANGATVVASATAEWRQTVALPFALNRCVLDAAGTAGTVFVGSGLYDGLANTVNSALGVVDTLGSDGDLVGYLEDVLSCGTDVLAGGWLASSSVDGECRYDPNLGTALVSILDRVLPVSSCTPLIQSLVGKRIIVPVYENSTSTLLGSVTAGAIGDATITRYAEIIVSGYEFNHLIGISGMESYPTAAQPSCVNTVSEILGVTDGGVAGLFDNLVTSLDNYTGLPLLYIVTQLLGPVLGPLTGLVDQAIVNVVDPLTSDLLDLVSLCQGVQGQIVATNYTAAQAEERLLPYRLVA